MKRVSIVEAREKLSAAWLRQMGTMVLTHHGHDIATIVPLDGGIETKPTAEQRTFTPYSKERQARGR